MMKNIYLYIVSLILIGASFASCNDWLDVDPIDSAKESTQFKTEAGIQAVLNGFYRHMGDNALYGGNLTQTAVEAMANRYVYNNTYAVAGNNSYYARYWANYEYEDNADIKAQIAAIWTKGYQLAFNINNYLKALSESSINLTENKRSILEGEAYALRAYMHFDLFRLFGPVYSMSNSTDSIMPYNSLSLTDNYEQQMVLLRNQTAPAFIDSVLADISRAEKRLEKSDPIISNFSNAVTPLLAGLGENDEVNNSYTYDFYNCNRNRRMNYYAVRALKARVLQYIGKTDEAAEIAQTIITKTGTLDTGTNTIKDGFAWATNIGGRLDYTFFSEVIFGINSLSVYENAEKWYLVSDVKSGYFVSNIYMDVVYDLTEGGDIRSLAMKNPGLNTTTGPTGISSVFHALRYSNKDSPNCTAGLNFQPLMRLSEMYYIAAEKYIADANFPEAASLLNKILEARGVSTLDQIGGANNPTLPDVASYSEDRFRAFLLKEYYREFGGEGQIFFHYKRLNMSYMMNSNDPVLTSQLLNPSLVYTFPIPDAETDY